jgi:hypothetical protein
VSADENLWGDKPPTIFTLRVQTPEKVYEARQLCLFSDRSQMMMGDMLDLYTESMHRDILKAMKEDGAA